MLNSLTLREFRNHRILDLTFNSGTTVLIGQNAMGKTNIAEAIYLLATGDSFRAGKIEEMVGWDAEVGHVIGRIGGSEHQKIGTSEDRRVERSEEAEVRVTLTRGVVQGKRVAKRSFVINGLRRRKQDVLGLLPAVLFRPENMDLITGNPAVRRQFLDEALSQTNPEYERSLVSYEKALKRRNKILDAIREGTTNRTALMFWDQLLIKEGGYLTNQREQFIETINATPALSSTLALDYQRSIISPARLKQYEREELILGYTLVGPHKDDFRIMDNGGFHQAQGDSRDVGVFGSRGEQRMAILWLKEAQLAFMEQALGERPLLILDDIFSELDREHGARVVELSSRQQTIVTTTQEEETGVFGNGIQLIRLPIAGSG